MRILRYVKVAVTFVVVVFLVLFILATVFVFPELGDALAGVSALGDALVNKRKGKAVAPAAWTVRRSRRKCGQAFHMYAPSSRAV